MRRHLSLALLGLVLALSAQAAGPGPHTTRAGLVMPDLQEVELANGLKLYVAERPHAPVVSLIMVIRSGVKDEPKDQRGVARLVEGLMTRGSTRVRPGDHARLIEGVGGTTSSRTLPDGTLYEDTVPRGQLPLALELEADRLRGLVFRDDATAAVKKEIGIANRRHDPLTLAIDQLAALAYTQHPYAWQGGVMPDLDGLTTQQAKAFYDAHYQPNNSALFIVGDVTVAEARKLVEERFGKLAKGEPAPRPSAGVTEPPQAEARAGAADRGSSVGLVTMAWKIPPAKHADAAALKVAMTVLAGGDAARLTQRLVKKDKSSPAAGGQLLLTEDQGLFIVYAAFREPAQQDKLGPAITDELARLARAPISAAELTAARKQLAAFTAFGTQRDVDLAYQFASSWVRAGDPEEFIRGMDDVMSVKPADVQRVAKAYLGVTQGTTLVVPLATGGGK